METKESKEKKLKELTDKDLEKVSGGINKKNVAKVCYDSDKNDCERRGGTFNSQNCKCEWSHEY